MDKVDEPRVRVAIHAENRLMREAIAASLGSRPGLFVVGTTATVEELHLLCVRHRPHVALVDAATVPPAIDALRRLRTISPGTDLVAIVSADLSANQVAAVHGAGASATVSGSDGLDAMLKVLRSCGRSAERRQPETARFTPGELRIVHLLGAGHSTPEIAALLKLRPRTVDDHKRHIYVKLGVSSQSHAVARAIALGLLDVPGQAGPGTETRRCALAVVHGPPGDCRDQVVRALVAQGRPFAVVRTRQPLDHDQWARWHRASVTVVLVDPEPADWTLPTSLGATTVVVRSGGAGDQAAILDALTHGAGGLIARDDVATDLGPMLTVVSRGHLAMSGVFAVALARWSPGGRTAVPVLTARERDILGFIASGHTIRQTAWALGIATKTVENTQARLFRKLGARNRAETLTLADGWGLVDRKAALANPLGMREPFRPAKLTAQIGHAGRDAPKPVDHDQARPIGGAERTAIAPVRAAATKP